jgi:hypothetical protein
MIAAEFARHRRGSGFIVYLVNILAFSFNEWDNQTKLSGGIGEQWQNTHPKGSLLREDRRTDRPQKRVPMLK